MIRSEVVEAAYRAFSRCEQETPFIVAARIIRNNSGVCFEFQHQLPRVQALVVAANVVKDKGKPVADWLNTNPDLDPVLRVIAEAWWELHVNGEVQDGVPFQLMELIKDKLED